MPQSVNYSDHMPKPRENYNHRTRNNALRYYRTPNIDFAKTTLETFDTLLYMIFGLFNHFSQLKYMYFVLM